VTLYNVKGARGAAAAITSLAQLLQNPATHGGIKAHLGVEGDHATNWRIGQALHQCEVTRIAPTTKKGAPVEIELLGPPSAIVFLQKNEDYLSRLVRNAVEEYSIDLLLYSSPEQLSERDVVASRVWAESATDVYNRSVRLDRLIQHLPSDVWASNFKHFEENPGLLT